MRAFAFSVMLLLASPVLAASPDPAGSKVRSQFYIFDGSSFEANAKGPSLSLMNPRQAARFSRLMSLKKDLLGGLGVTLKERTLK